MMRKYVNATFEQEKKNRRTLKTANKCSSGGRVQGEQLEKGAEPIKERGLKMHVKFKKKEAHFVPEGREKYKS